MFTQAVPNNNGPVLCDLTTGNTVKMYNQGAPTIYGVYLFTTNDEVTLFTGTLEECQDYMRRLTDALRLEDKLIEL